MKKFIPQPSIPKTEEIRHIEQEKDRWERRGFVKEVKDSEVSEIVPQESESAKEKFPKWLRVSLI